MNRHRFPQFKTRGRRPITSNVRNATHKLAGIAFWALFVVLWVLLLEHGRVTLASARDTALELAVLVGAVLGITLWWIRHNVAIYQRKGPRTGRATIPPVTANDRLGRTVRWQLPGGVHSARTADRLVIQLDGDVKVYRQES